MSYDGHVNQSKLRQMLNCTLLSLTATLGAASLLSISPYSSARSFSVVSSRFSRSFDTAFRFSALNLHANFQRTQFSNLINSAIRVSGLFYHNAEIHDRQVFSGGSRKEEITVDSCMFRNCRTYTPQSASGGGGAIFVESNSLYTSLSLVRSSFANCTTTQGGNGGAIAFANEALHMLETCFADCLTSSTREGDENSGGAVFAITHRSSIICGCSFFGCPKDSHAVSYAQHQQTAVVLSTGQHDIDDTNFTNNYYKKGVSGLSTIGATSLELKYVEFHNQSGAVVLHIEDPSQHVIQNLNLIENDLTNGKSESVHGIIEFSGENLRLEDCFFKVFNQEEHNRILASASMDPDQVMDFVDCNFDLEQSAYLAPRAKYQFDGKCQFNYDGPSNKISVFNSEECWFVEPERHAVGSGVYIYLPFLFMFIGVIAVGAYFQAMDLLSPGLGGDTPADITAPIKSEGTYTDQ